jgi:hypothetical protein
MLWSSPMYQGTISGAFKNALDWLHVLGAREPAFLHDEVIGLISAAGGTHGLQAINTMEFATQGAARMGRPVRCSRADGGSRLRPGWPGPGRRDRAAAQVTRRRGRARRPAVRGGPWASSRERM